MTTPVSTPVPGGLDSEALVDFRRRRLVNFGLIGLTLAAFAAAGLFWAWQYAAHSLASAWLRGGGFQVTSGEDPNDPSRSDATLVRATAPRMIGSEPSTAYLIYLPWLRHVDNLDLANLVGLTDAEVAFLDGMTETVHLNLDRSQHVGPLYTDPRYLTDAVLKPIGRMKRLEDLNLGGHEITDEGLANLRGLDRLRVLDLRMTKVTDAAFDVMKDLPGLKAVDLTGTSVTVAGRARFEAARPGVTVLADHLPAPVLDYNPKAPR
jgi:hypothetical protein